MTEVEPRTLSGEAVALRPEVEDDIEPKEGCVGNV
jgi:hypothetical protein